MNHADRKMLLTLISTPLSKSSGSEGVQEAIHLSVTLTPTLVASVADMMAGRLSGSHDHLKPNTKIPNSLRKVDQENPIKLGTCAL